MEIDQSRRPQVKSAVEDVLGRVFDVSPRGIAASAIQFSILSGIAASVSAGCDLKRVGVCELGFVKPLSDAFPSLSLWATSGLVVLVPVYLVMLLVFAALLIARILPLVLGLGVTIWVANQVPEAVQPFVSVPGVIISLAATYAAAYLTRGSGPPGPDPGPPGRADFYKS